MFRWVTALVCLLVGVPVVAAAEPFDDIISAYRKMIILADGAARGSWEPAQQTRAVAVARFHYSRQHELVEASLGRAQRDAVLTPSSRLTAQTLALLDHIASRDDLRDGDLLALGGLVDELLALEQFRVGDGPRLAPVRQLHERIAAVLGSYREEYTRAMSQLITRGEGARESWDHYIAAISVRYPFPELLASVPDEVMVQRLEAMAADQEASPAPVQGAPQVIWGGGLPEKTVVLSFDDGPHALRTNRVLDILAEYDATAYFFTLGQKLGSVSDEGVVTLGNASATARRIVEDGHVLANHSFSHRAFSRLSEDERARELSKTNQLISAIGGEENTLFRPPYGVKDKDLDALAARKGMASIMWNIDSMDWADPIPESIADRTLRALDQRGSGILLFHDIHRQTVEALPTILTALAQRGYRVVALDGQPFNEVTGGALTLPVRDERLYANSWAVVIGINDYQHWPRLQYAVNDARAVGDMLAAKLGFPEQNIIRLYDAEATRERIIEALGYHLSDPERVGENDRVFVFFAGHGTTRSMPDGGSLGYIIPADADLQRYQIRGISMSELDDFSASIPAKHVFFVMDSCYSGLALTRAGVTTGQSQGYLERITQRRARQILTAGGADEEVADGGPGGHSIFTWTLLQGLMGLADTDDNGYVTASELGTYLAPVVSSYASQTPVFGNLVGSQGGDFVFRLEAHAVAEVSQALSREAEQVEQQMQALRRDTQSDMRRRLDLQVALERDPDALAVAPTDAAADADRIREARRYNASALEFFQEGRLEEARREWEEAVRLNPFNPTIVNNYGYVLYNLGEYEEALVWYFRTVELSPRRIPLYLNLGDVMVKLGRYREAIPYYERYLHLYPSYDKADELRKTIEALADQES
ncbi:polysaccharide deacetylase family protein [Isoalcanivorax indicus]|uniref:polysaccharide deacetylase family protein n=1 Tax=Isoalcanivorax indicus TaxID=2202653 RepID=UPI000DB96E74|nr:polysaccharide deacetylase family protein [Isoalcanivorax indicus]